MEDKVEVIKEFIQYNIGELKEKIISETRGYLRSQDEYHIEGIKDKMVRLDFLEGFLINEDAIWDWAEDYYGEDNDDEEN